MLMNDAISSHHAGESEILSALDVCQTLNDVETWNGDVVAETVLEVVVIECDCVSVDSQISLVTVSRENVFEGTVAVEMMVVVATDDPCAGTLTYENWNYVYISSAAFLVSSSKPILVNLTDVARPSSQHRWLHLWRQLL